MAKKDEKEVKEKEEKEELGGIDRQDLLDVLNKLKAGLDMRGEIQGADYFIFDKDKISSYNNEVSVSVEFPIGIEGSVIGEDFHGMIREADVARISLETDEGKITMKGGTFNAKMQQREDIDEIKALISSLQLSDLDWEPLPSDILEGMRYCSFTVTDDIPLIAGLSVMGKDVVSSDNIRISWYTLDEPIEGRIRIAGKSVKELLQYADLTEFSTDPGWAHFRSSSKVIYSCRIIPEDFPDVEGHFKDDGEVCEIVFPSGFNKTLKRVEILCAGKGTRDKEIELDILKKKIVCRGEKPERGSIEEVAACDYNGKSIKNLRINPIFLRQIISKNNVMKHVPESGKVMFETDKFKHLMMLFEGEE